VRTGDRSRSRETVGTGGTGSVHRERQESSWKALKPRFGTLQPDTIDRAVCRAYTADRRGKGRANNIIRKELSDLRADVNWHEKHNRAQFDLPPADPPRDRRLTRYEFAKLLDAAAITPHLINFLHLAIATAGRK